MTDEEKPVTLEFLARQMDRMLDRLGTMEDQITVLTGIAMRLDGAVEGLATEVREDLEIWTDREKQIQRADLSRKRNRSRMEELKGSPLRAADCSVVHTGLKIIPVGSFNGPLQLASGIQCPGANLCKLVLAGPNSLL
jgi:hypothetical protein